MEEKEEGSSYGDCKLEISSSGRFKNSVKEKSCKIFAFSRGREILATLLFPFGLFLL